ncbi:polysaccharide biosynthesis C-terminal domain-containing protein [Halohasta litorea]|uniref:Polysaccharide biosynthesis C-terminal domain-containing protein n=1 Tax=Halohasta litorea TaxID=869891 RepID=A0ABD6D8M8_9EURY|nr:polysaccharide biosynthesis C-terminal domain-containing protein [Halohasta litorea]
MRIGQKAGVVFVSKLFASVLGFITTIYFARVLGAEVIGFYTVTMSLVAWLKLGGNIGVSTAVTKRISEGRQQSEFFTVGWLVIGLFAIIFSTAIILFRQVVDNYVGVEVWFFVVLLLLSGLFSSYIQSALTGEAKVHISGLLSPTNLIISSISQLTLVYFEFGLEGMIVGYLLGEIASGLIGSGFISSSLTTPKRKHISSLFEYAKFSWLGSVKNRAYNDTDILVLGALVPSSLVGVYGVAWTIARFLELFGMAVRNTLFPEISGLDPEEDEDEIAGYVNDSLAFTGLIVTPGLLGGIVLGDYIMLIYGGEFVRGSSVLGILILATLLYTYQQQMMGAINALNRPDITFKINAVLISTNVVMNVALVYFFGWIGAAVATAFTMFIGTFISYIQLNRMVKFKTPIREIVRQIISAVIMAVGVYGAKGMIQINEVESAETIVSLLLLISFGAVIYFTIIYVLSGRFRGVLVRNLPWNLN